MLKETTLFETIDRVRDAIDYLKHVEPDEGYYLAFSGGKDSIVIKKLVDMAGVKYDAHYSVTTIDPPELVRFIKQHHPDVEWERPEQAFLTRLVVKGFPQRQRRWCCEEYKERGGAGRLVVTGIRRAESSNRAKRKQVEVCYKDTTKRYLNIIIDWSDEDVWEFIHKHNLPYCSLYNEGWKRIGCLFCPMASKHRTIEAKRYPGYVKAFITAFERMYAYKKSQGATSVDRWADGEEMFWWWLDEKRQAKDGSGQMVMFE